MVMSFKKLCKLLYQSGWFSKVKSLEKEWREDAQTFEFNFHKVNEFRQSQAFITETERLLISFGFTYTDYEDMSVIDLGAGSKLRSKFFAKAKIIAVEPLADRFINELAWCDLQDSWKVYSQPAEFFIKELEQSANFIMSINVLDHCFDFPKIVKNMYRYLVPGSLAFISFDKHLETNIGHPLILTENICSKIFIDCGFYIEKFISGFPVEFTRFYPGRSGYSSNNSISLNYWLRKGK